MPDTARTYHACVGCGGACIASARYCRRCYNATPEARGWYSRDACGPVVISEWVREAGGVMVRTVEGGA